MPQNRVSLDRITIVGEIKMDLRQLIDELGNSWEFYDGALVLVHENENETLENIAYFAESQFRPFQFRLDFNPNNLLPIEAEEINRVVQLMVKPHFSRLDIAFDVFNNDLAMKYRVYRFNVSEDQIETFRGRDKSVETIYWGKRKSEQQIRLYDKYVEQKSRRKEIDSDIKSWARLELQLRGGRTNEWLESAKQMLSEFKISRLDQIENVNDRLALSGIENGVVQWTDFASQKRAYLRKLIKNNQGYDDDLAVELMKLLEDNVENIKQDLDFYLNKFGVK